LEGDSSCKTTGLVAAVFKQAWSLLEHGVAKQLADGGHFLGVCDPLLLSPVI
jgi:hypothetical protein